VTKDDLFNRVWNDAPAAKYLIGRRGMREMTGRIVSAWQIARLIPTDDRDPDASHVAAEMFDSVAAQYSFVWMIVFQALLSFAIQSLLEWWFSSSEVRTVMIAWQQETQHERN
jgi:hypothetical protein